MDFYSARGTGSPLPTTLEDALREIMDLRRILTNERQMLVKAIERRELDNRSAAGHIRVLREENETLRLQIKPKRKKK